MTQISMANGDTIRLGSGSRARKGRTSSKEKEEPAKDSLVDAERKKKYRTSNKVFYADILGRGGGRRRIRSKHGGGKGVFTTELRRLEVWRRCV
ncbi:hypothetical protein CEXT_381151 [Caerostris extrusa]|uniref:Uncharacterized protein n=1 Tax=Caerostris extrusa TaxID=172846 RepID=A0AAV4SLW0_CAEEX|nr:hypothetical protein CEXT_381151 [Caerostris extrusa]